MTPNSRTNDSAAVNSKLSGDHSRKVSSENVQDQTLLKALQDLIVRVVDPNQKNETNKIQLGPEAGKLITALQEFISSIIVRSQSGVQNTMEVSFIEEEDKLQEVEYLGDNGKDDDSDMKMGVLSRLPALNSGGGANRNRNPEHLGALKKPSPETEGALLRALREHVFNMMPTRLLCFEPHGSNFQITLLDRSAIYKRLEPVLQANFLEGGFRSGLVQKPKQVVAQLIHKFAGYAILSHTWLRTTPGEITYGDWNTRLLDASDPGYQKLFNFCKTAWKDHRLMFGWMDTVCINKESSSELDESIRSMYNWYSRAAVCVAYLSETETLAGMRVDPWFTRGWTLQELVAPEIIKFYNSDWKRLVDHSANDKKDTEIAKQIKRATTMSKHELENIRDAPISRRMQLAATREVTREEDTAYALMGIFNVSFSTAYGEGAARAFSRLLQEILNSSENALDLLNWAGGLPDEMPHNSRILPISPKSYLNHSTNRNLKLWRPTEPLTLMHLGLRVPVLLMPGLAATPGSKHDRYYGEYIATVHISPQPTSPGPYYMEDPPAGTYDILDKGVWGSDGWRGSHLFQMTFAVFNFSRTLYAISVPKTCIAKGLVCEEVVGSVSTQKFFKTVETKEPIVFELSRKPGVYKQDSHDQWFWFVPEDELRNHGIQLINLYL